MVAQKSAHGSFKSARITAGQKHHDPEDHSGTMQRDPTQDNSSSLLLSALIRFHARVNLRM